MRTRGLLARLLQERGIVVVHVTEARFGVAMDAWLRYGKGRHPASLNFGDCLRRVTRRKKRARLHAYRLLHNGTTIRAVDGSVPTRFGSSPYGG